MIVALPYFPTLQSISTVAFVHSRRNRPTLPGSGAGPAETASCFSVSLCWSQACLGKKAVFQNENGAKKAFSAPRPERFTAGHGATPTSGAVVFHTCQSQFNRNDVIIAEVLRSGTCLGKLHGPLASECKAFFSFLFKSCSALIGLPPPRSPPPTPAAARCLLLPYSPGSCHAHTSQSSRVHQNDRAGT